MRTPKILAFTLIVFLISNFQASAKMLLFVTETCSHCQKLEEYLEKNELYQKHDIEQYEIYDNEKNRNLYLAKAIELNYRNGGVPWLVDGKKNIEGTNSIITYLNSLDNENQLLTPAPKQTVLDEQQSEMLNEMIKEEIKKDQSFKNNESENSKKTNKYFPYVLILSLFGASFYFAKLTASNKSKGPKKR